MIYVCMLLIGADLSHCCPAIKPFIKRATNLSTAEKFKFF